MSTSPDQAPHEAALFRTIREWGITRGDNGIIGGVAEGLGERIGMARVPARIILVVAAIPLTGLVFLAYAAAWALLPDRKGNIIVQNFGRGIPNVGALIGIGILTLIGLGGLDNSRGLVFDTGSWNGDVPWSDASSWGVGHVAFIVFAVLVPLVVIGGVITAIVLLVKKSGNGTEAGPGATYAVPPAPAAPHGFTSPRTAETADDSNGSPIPTSAAATPPAVQWAPAPPAPPAPPRRPRVPGPGRAFYLLTLAWVAISAAAAAWLERADRLEVHPGVAGAVVFVTGLGVILMAVSLSGRKLGFLGFIGITSILPLLIFAGNAEELRTAYAENGGVSIDGVGTDESIPTEPATPAPAFDPTLKFPGLYATIYVDGYCQEGDWQDYGSSSVARLNLTESSAGTPVNTSVDITAEVTYVTIATGSNVTITGDPNAPATVVFPGRGFTCDFQNTGQKYLELTNPGAPTINLVVHDDQYTNTIVIKEVAP
ncbi:MAG: PspC domain-containing protein [Demequinaceae bacterium]|nr:PspC domain-containing protein [Demequinaceae bacterium]